METNYAELLFLLTGVGTFVLTEISKKTKIPHVYVLVGISFLGAALYYLLVGFAGESVVDSLRESTKSILAYAVLIYAALKPMLPNAKH